jgi:hypothetical protein
VFAQAKQKARVCTKRASFSLSERERKRERGGERESERKKVREREREGGREGERKREMFNMVDFLF